MRCRQARAMAYADAAGRSAHRVLGRRVRMLQSILRSCYSLGCACKGMPKHAGGVPMPMRWLAWHGAPALEPLHLAQTTFQLARSTFACRVVALGSHAFILQRCTGYPLGRLELLRQPTPIRISWAWQCPASSTRSSNRAGYHDVQAHSTALTVAASDAKRLTCQHSSLAMHALSFAVHDSVYQPVRCTAP